MRVALRIVGITLGLVGLIWSLQGMDLLQGSPMTGEPFWSGAGLALILVSLGLLYMGFRSPQN